MTKSHDGGWREWVLGNTLPKMEANTGPAASFTPATDFGPITFNGNRTPNNPADLLQGMALAKWTAIKQRADDLLAQVPLHEQLQELRNEVTGHGNRIADLTKRRGEGGPELSEEAPQVQSERKRLLRAEQEFARVSELKEVRTARWNAAGSLARNVSDWLLHGGVPVNCALEPVDDPPLSELLVKADGGRLDAATERYRQRRRELAADAHRVNSSPWPSSEQKRKAAEFINQLAERGRPNFEAMVEHNAAFTFPTTMLRSMVHGVETPALAFANDIPDMLAVACWALRDQLLALSNRELDEVADDKVALDQKQRDIALAQISADMLSAERSECACIWAAEARNNEILDFRGDTSAAAALGISLRTTPRADPPPTSEQYVIVYAGGRR